MGCRRLAAAALAVGVAFLTVPATADAQVEEGIGYSTPAQGYRDKPSDTDWLGSYRWNGQHVWCVQYSLLAPDSSEMYKDRDELRTKAGEPLPPDVAANISYLLLRYTTDPTVDEAAALAHLLHTWTAAPQGRVTLDPANDFRHIAYNEQFHFDHLPQAAKDAVVRLRADAEANRGPWAAKVTAPAKEQLIGSPGTWAVDIAKADGVLVGDVPVTVELEQATLADGKTSVELRTPVDGKPLAVDVVPTGAQPTFRVRLDSPADKPVVHVPANTDMQRIVTTGGEKKLAAEASAVARTQPGVVKVGKTDTETGKAIAGAALRITGPDGVTPALRQDDAKVTGPDGNPIVLQSGEDGTATVSDLRTPQEVCVVEVAAAKGYEEHFDPAAPPKACGKVEPGQTLALALTNKPNKPIVPIAIHAGADGAGVVAKASFSTTLNTGALIGFGGVVLLGAVLVGFVARRRAAARS
ncbi:SpaA isopeptide-forming pilin-related protein [Actinosynnema sp. CS-041913]|uniref:SpaA isopeptide-forming pilin-related protein n=1 Tax=Actinosynnema sp. CS-041913 TaxID=3239917 RepID=UPI003D9225C6